MEFDVSIAYPHESSQINTEMAYTIFTELNSDNQNLRAENSTLREKLAQLEEENERKDQIIADQAERLHLRDTRIANLEFIFDWLRDLFRNPNLTAAVKIVLFQYFWHVSSLRVDIHTKTGIMMERIAQDSGISVDTVRRANKFLVKRTDTLAVESETKIRNDGQYKTYVNIQLLDIMTPDQIKVYREDGESKQGGERKKGCPKCGCHYQHRYTVTHCPECGEVAIYGQPGNRKDADPRKMMDAIVAKVKKIHAGYSNIDSNNSQNITGNIANAYDNTGINEQKDQKQLAFGHSNNQQYDDDPDIATYDSDLPDLPNMPEPTPIKATPKKQDAHDQDDPLEDLFDDADPPQLAAPKVTLPVATIFPAPAHYTCGTCNGPLMIRKTKIEVCFCPRCDDQTP